MTRIAYTPRPWQPPMTNHILEHPRVAVWATMGTGKTVATYTALDALFMAGDPYPALVLGTKRVARDVWPADALKWDHLSNIEVVSLVGSTAQREAAVRRPASVHTVNYDVLPWLIEYWGDRWPYKIVVADESTRLKSLRIAERVSSKGKVYLQGQGGKRAKALGFIAHTPKIERVVELSGTPSPNGLKDLWGPTWFLDAGQRLGRTFSGFTKRWFRTGYNGFDLEPLPHAEAEIHARLKDICLTVDLADYVDIAEPIFKPIYVELPPKARAKYREMEKHFFAEFAGHEVNAQTAAAKTQKLLQLASGAVYVEPEVETDANPRAKKYVVVHDAKLEALESVIEEAAGMPILCGYEFRSDRERILKSFPGAADLATDAGMKAFRAGKVPLGLAHPASLGHGVDGLQDVTNILAFFGHNWDLELYLQLLGRIGPVRQMQSGHKRPVFVYPIIARDTVDEDVIERRKSKTTVQQALMNAMKRRAQR